MVERTGAPAVHAAGAILRQVDVHGVVGGLGERLVLWALVVAEGLGGPGPDVEAEERGAGDVEARARAADDRSLPLLVRIAREGLANQRETIARMERELADDSAYRAYVEERLAQAKRLAAEP